MGQQRKKVQKIKWCRCSGQPKAGNLWTMVAMEELYFFSQTDPKFSEETLLLFIINTPITWLNLCGCHYWHKKLQGKFKPYKNIPFITEGKTQIVSTLNLVGGIHMSLVCLLGRFSHTVWPQQTLTVYLERGSHGYESRSCMHPCVGSYPSWNSTYTRFLRSVLRHMYRYLFFL